MLLALIHRIDRPWGPFAVAIAASMKFAPILLVFAYVARREWWRAGVTMALTGLLILPALAMGIADAAIRSDAAPSLLGVSPVLYVVVVCAAVGATFLVPRRFVFLTAATAAVLALPRLFVYDVTLVSVGAAEPGSAKDR